MKNWNWSGALDAAAQRWPHKRAVVGPTSLSVVGRQSYEHVTFSELQRQVRACAAGWAKRGLRKGDRVLIMARPSVDFMIGVLGLMRIGAVPVLIDGGLPMERIIALIMEAEAKGMLTGPEALAFRSAGPLQAIEIVVASDVVTTQADTVRALVGEGGDVVEPAQLEADDLIAIVFTSGSTGLPKGVETTARMGFAGAEWLAQDGMGENDSFLAILPSHLLGALSLGVTCVMPQMDITRPGSADPKVLVSQIEQQGITYTVGPPSVWENIAAYCEAHGVKLGSLRHVSISGAPVYAPLMRKLQRAIPNGIVHTPLGATEGSPISDITAAEIIQLAPATERGAGICVGRVIPEHEIRVIDIEEGPLAQWSEVRELATDEVGELVMAGPVVSERYFRRDTDTRKAKIKDAQGRVWHRLGDCGYRDQEGRVWYCGRVAHVVTRQGKRFYPVMIEGALNPTPGVARSALVGTQGGEMVLVVQPQADVDRAGQPRLATLLVQRARELGWPLDRVLFHPGALPTDARHNSKIERGALSEFASQQLRAQASVVSAATE
jgi:olefin beta-lactone synthetase